MTTSNAFCFIPAKASSTRLPKKNILPLAGKELIYYVIRAAQQSQLFGNEIIVSTESEEISSIANKYQAKTPYLRDPHLAHDPYGVKDVLLDFLERLPEYKHYEQVCIILPTAPFVSPEDIAESYQLFKEQEYPSLLSVTETDHNALRSVFIRQQIIEPLSSAHLPKKSQELEPTYRINGAVIWLRTQQFIQHKSFFIQPIGAYVMPKHRSVDIDTDYDYQLAQFLIQYYGSGPTPDHPSS